MENIERVACVPDDWTCPYYSEGECLLQHPWVVCDEYIEAMTEEEKEWEIEE